MINRQTEELAAQYVLDLLEDEERPAFESAMRDSPELQRFVTELADGLYDPLRKADAACRPDLLDGILERTGEALPGPGSGDPPSLASSGPTPWVYIWAAAAVILLGMNFLLLFLVRDQSSLGDAGLLTSQDGAATNAATAESGEIPLNAGDRTVLEARIARLENELSYNEALAEQYQSDLQQARKEAGEVRDYNTEWQREYARLAARILPFFERNDGLGRFTVIEMVDNEVFSEDLPRQGFADLAGRFLSGEGNIAGIGTDEFIGPVVEGAGVLSATPDSSQAGLEPIARGSGAPISDDSAAPTEVTGPHSPQASEGESRPTGFTVWRDDEQKGFLDLYNLPEVAEGQEAYLWVRAGELDPYVPVGVVPRLENGTGSLFFSIDEPNFTPTEILITAEESGAAGPVPGDSVILRGP